MDIPEKSKLSVELRLTDRSWIDIMGKDKNSPLREETEREGKEDGKLG